jgi:hypothetical protein
MTMRIYSIRLLQKAVLTGGLLCMASGLAVAQAANVVTVSGSPATMNITTAAGAGFGPTSVVNSITTYTSRAKKATNPMKITAQLDAVMPAGVTLTIDMVPTTGGVDFGVVTLDATARDVIGNITNTTNETHAITYTLSATVTAGVVTSQSRTVTLTIVAYP